MDAARHRWRASALTATATGGKTAFAAALLLFAAGICLKVAAGAFPLEGTGIFVPFFVWKRRINRIFAEETIRPCGRENRTDVYEQEKIMPYGEGGRKGAQVERMFDGIAHSYDLLNHLLSLGIDRRWRRAAIDSLRPYAPQRLLDVATGTGDFALLSARRLRPAELLGVDLSEGMLDVARRKTKAAGLDGVIRFERADCMNLSLPADTFDAVTVAYGIRNFEDLDRGLQEMRRVLRPGGRLVIIELCTPQGGLMRRLFRFYSHVLMPAVGRLVSRDGRAYTYLPATMEAFPQGEVMQGILEKAGFRDVSFRRFTFGLSTLYTAAK